MERKRDDGEGPSLHDCSSFRELEVAAWKASTRAPGDSVVWAAYIHHWGVLIIFDKVHGCPLRRARDAGSCPVTSVRNRQWMNYTLVINKKLNRSCLEEHVKLLTADVVAAMVTRSVSNLDR
ncbi:hypothetical protein EVAR_89697_1 [Eumeta japonica]|uniref:Uncharacterized protein n=1 Tax=Eumeta variegata TaxID=151549 RepID=A0A4C1WYW4_EUMVA|nr:hypothetical protein EVAR_89697_1 [Eumeta japonica]